MRKKNNKKDISNGNEQFKRYITHTKIPLTSGRKCSSELYYHREDCWSVILELQVLPVDLL